MKRYGRARLAAVAALAGGVAGVGEEGHLELGSGEAAGPPHGDSRLRSQVMGDRGSEVRLAEIMTALSLATDLGMGQPLEQALRVCVAAMELGRRLGCPPAAVSDIYYVALLEHLGCTATAAEIAAWNGGDDLAFRSWAIALAHAGTGETLGQFSRHVGEGRGLPVRARLLAAGLVAGDQRFGRLVAVP